MAKNRTEWVMHVWGKRRETLELNDVEKFHLDVLKMYQSQQKKFDRILINIALDDVNDMNLFNFLKSEIGKVFTGDNVEFRYCQNDPNKCEYVTFRPYVFDRIGENVNVFYSHFKGYGSALLMFRKSFPVRLIDLNEKFWAYIMYRYSLNISDVQKVLKDHCTYSWYTLKNNVIGINLKYMVDYQTYIQNINETYKEYIEDDLNKHSPGSFVWYNLKRIDDAIKNKPLIKEINAEQLLKSNKISLCPHFCELYLMPFLKEEECYSVNDFNKEIGDMINTPYGEMYVAKTVGKEYIKDFEKYLIENSLI